MLIEGEIVIDRPVEEVFDSAADERNEPRFNPRMTRAEKITSGPIGPGTRFSAEMTGMGRQPRWSSSSPLLGRMGRRQEQTIWAGLKRHLEAGPVSSTHGTYV